MGKCQMKPEHRVEREQVQNKVNYEWILIDTRERKKCLNLETLKINDEFLEEENKSRKTLVNTH